jgi:chlorobactene glucosyltransferase
MPEISLTNFFELFAWSIVALWLAALFWTWFCLEKQKPLDLCGQRKAAINPLISIIVPARNEAHRVLEKSISSMLAQTYENFEIIVLNDRSTDETGAILAEIKLRNSHSAFQIINGIDPPAGWLGKPHALEQALKSASGEWILTADADVLFAPETLSTVVDYVEINNFDALTLAPKLIFGSFWETLFMPVFAWFCLLAMPLHRVNDAGRKETIGVGSFFMFRRTVLEKIGGFETVRAEVAEDLKLAEILKQKGFKLRVDFAPELIETRMYAGFWEIWSGFTKNLFSGMKFSVVKTIFSLFAILVCGVLPLFFAVLSLIFGEIGLYVPLFTAYLLQVVVFIFIQKKWRGNALYAFLTPLGLLIFAAILANSTVKVLSGKGVVWKGRAIYERGGIEPPQ